MNGSKVKFCRHPGTVVVSNNFTYKGEQMHKKRHTTVEATEKLMKWIRPKIRNGRRGGGGRAEAENWDWVEQVCTWKRFKWALHKMKAKTAVGEDGWSAYLLRMAPEKMQRGYHEDLKDIIRERTFPEEWKERIGLLAMKAGEHPANLPRRRDLWIGAHGSKLVMLLLGSEYERACKEAVPGSQGGFTAGKAAPGRTLVLRAQKEQCEAERTGCYRMYADMGIFFMSCAREVQAKVEKWCGVRPEVTEVVMALHNGSKGRYETAYGLTGTFGFEEGNPQGCTQSPARSKLMLSLIQGSVRKLCKGFRFRGAKKRTPQIFFADDGAFCAEDLATLQLTIDTVWMVTKIAGLKLPPPQTPIIEPQTRPICSGPSPHVGATSDV